MMTRACKAAAREAAARASPDTVLSPLPCCFSVPLLRAAVAKADITGQRCEMRNFFVPDICATLLRELVKADTVQARILTEMRVSTSQFWSEPQIRALLKAAPALQLLEASLYLDDHRVARAMLRNEPGSSPAATVFARLLPNCSCYSRILFGFATSCVDRGDAFLWHHADHCCCDGRGR